MFFLLSACWVGRRPREEGKKGGKRGPFGVFQHDSCREERAKLRFLLTLGMPGKVETAGKREKEWGEKKETFSCINRTLLRTKFGGEKRKRRRHICLFSIDA